MRDPLARRPLLPIILFSSLRTCVRHRSSYSEKPCKHDMSLTYIV